MKLGKCELCGRDRDAQRNEPHKVKGPSWENEDMCPACGACYCDKCREANR